MDVKNNFVTVKLAETLLKISSHNIKLFKINHELLYELANVTNLSFDE